MSERTVEDPAAVANLLGLLRRRGAEVECEVRGGSMGTAVPDRSTVRIRLDGAVDAPPGTAVAVLLAGNNLSVHRLLARGRSAQARGYILTQGDGNLFCDAPLPDTALLGRVIAVSPPGEADWQPVPPPALPTPLRRLAGGVVGWGVRQALALHPRLAIMLKNALVLAVTPIIWLRPYPPGRTRTTSRLVVGEDGRLGGR